MRGFIVGLIFSISSCLALTSSVSATQPDSLWPKSGNYTVNQTNTIDTNAINLCTQQTIKTAFYPNSPRNERDACVYETEYGSVADSGHIKRFVGDYLQLGPSVIPVPGTSKMYARTCSSSCFLIYYDTTQGFYGSNTSNGYKLIPRALPTPVKNPANDQTLKVFSIGFSSNGKWLAIETTGGFVRYDTETGGFLKFSNPRGSYGVGQDPSFKYSITDDGRYVVLSGSNYRYATVFDLDTCTGGSATDPVGVLAACESVELVNIANSKSYNVSALYGAAFRAGDREITAYGPDGDNKTQGYVFRLDSLEARADYVALGDSFSSGEGDIRDSTRYLHGTDGTVEFPKEKCHISNRSYPYLLQRQSAVVTSFFKSLACSGATARDIIGTNSDGRKSYIGHFRQGENMSDIAYEAVKVASIDSDIMGRAPQYKFIEKYQPKNITITIGGNDAGFGNVLSTCVLPGTCSFESTDRAAKALEMRSKYQVLRETYRKIRNASPNATLYVLSYPQFIDDDIQCNPNVGLNEAERKFVRESVKYFNQVIRQAALAEGATYIDIEDSLEGEALCSSKTLGLAVNGVLDGNDVYGVIAQESFHPNSRGHELIANYIEDTYGSFPNLAGETCPTESCAAYRAPAIPDYFNVLPTTVERYAAVLLDELEPALKRGKEFQMKFNGFTSNLTGKVWIHSAPRLLGNVIADSTGEFKAAFTLPADLEPGYHELHLETTAMDGTKVSYYQPLTVYAADEDWDGDGVLNTVDACNFVETSGTDVDLDGIDDACDGDLYRAPTVSKEPVGVQPPPIQEPQHPAVLSPADSPTLAMALTNQGDVAVAGSGQPGQVAGISDIKMDKPTSTNQGGEQEQGLPMELLVVSAVMVTIALITAFIYKLRKA